MAGFRGWEDGRRRQSGALHGVAIVLMAIGRKGEAQDVFTLGFEGPATLAGKAGEIQGETYYATLGHTGVLAGAQGWSLSMSSEGATIVAITTAGTVADTVENGGLWNSGFNKTEVIDPAKNGGTTGAVSGVLLSLTEGTTLSRNATSRIAKLSVEAKIPTGRGAARLLYLSGLRGSGQPVNNVITQDGDSQTPIKSPLSISLVEAMSCCDDPVNVGFSGDRIEAGTVFSGIADASTLCSASGGEIVQEVPEGKTGARRVYANVSSNFDPLVERGVQGWSFSILFTGGDQISLDFSTTAGTTAERKEHCIPFCSDFGKTQIIDPAKNGGKRGTVSGVVLSLTEGTILPQMGTESVLAIGLSSKVPQGDDDIVGNFSFLSGLRGSGQPVHNVITVDGDSKSACNFATAEVDVIFRKSSVVEFIRGNSNNDEKVDIADAIWSINALFRGGDPVLCEDAGDSNDDGILDATDVVLLIDHLFKGLSGPPAPYPECGADPSDDELSCDPGSVSSC